jgi:hypothetical protein
MQEPQDFRTLKGLSVEFAPFNRAANTWSATILKKYENGQAVWIDLSFEELHVLKRELDKFLD